MLNLLIVKSKTILNSVLRNQIIITIIKKKKMENS